MKYIEFGTQKKKVSSVMVGCMRIGDMSETSLEQLIESAMEQGINAFDHADIYAGGESERIFGRFLEKKPSLREELFLQSKCGIRDGFFDFSKEYILQSVDGILARLKTDYLDSLLLHRPDALMEPEEVAEAFHKLKEQGKVRDFGVSNMNPMQMELLQKYIGQPLAANQLQFSAAHTCMLDAGFHVNMGDEAGIMRDGSVLEYCHLHDIAVQSWSSLQYGYFEGTFLGAEQYEELNRQLAAVGEELGVDKATVAIAWILRYPARMQAVIGSTKKERICQMAKAGDLALSREQWYAIYRAAGNILP